MTRFKTVVLAFIFFVTILVVTHAAKFPGSLAYLMEVTHGQPILDLKASFSSVETYQRLDAFGEMGRQLYMQTMLTIDTIFPVSAFLFLFILAKYASEQMALKSGLATVLKSLSIVYVTLDFLENATVGILLSNYPTHIDFLAANIGYLTVGKRLSMYGAFFIPLVLFGVPKLIKFVQRERRPQISRQAHK